MSIYIDADRLINDLLKSTPIDWGNYVVEMKEEKQGRWLVDELGFETIYTCSECNEAFVTMDGTPAKKLWHYCPNCGAKMDADDNYCDDENCETFLRDLNCDRCPK